MADWDDLAQTRRSVREYLDTLDEAAWGAASEARPKFVSRSDPAAQWTGALKGHAFFAYPEARSAAIAWSNGARDELHLAAAAQNLRKLARLLPNGPQIRAA